MKNNYFLSKKIFLFVVIAVFNFMLIFSIYNIPKCVHAEEKVLSVEITDNLLMDKSFISEQEKINLNSLFETSNNNQKIFSNNTFVPERYVTLKDVDEKFKYLYVEYENFSGYAIYDRQEEFIYESSQVGEGPYNNYIENEELYYLGPTQFYVKTRGELEHIVTKQKCIVEGAIVKSNNVERIRDKYKNNQASAYSIDNMDTYANKTFYLGEMMNNDSKYKTDVSLYYLILSMYEQSNFVAGYNTSIELKLDCNPYKIFKDIIYAKNEYGSCAFVALSSILMFYERLAVADFLPNNISNFRLMYNNTFWFNNDWFGDNCVYLNKIDKNLIPSEFLHQELLNIAFPEKLGTSLSRNSFAATFNELKTTYDEYINKYGLDKYNFKVKMGTVYLPETIVSGNPVIVGISGGYPHSNSISDSHAVIAYGFNGTHTLWYTLDSIICNYCWDNPNTAIVNVNKEFIDDYSYIDVF